MKRKSKILIGLAIVFVALLVALFLARKQFVGGPGSPTVEGSRAVTHGGIKIPGWNGRVDAAEERAGMTLDAARLVGEGQALHVTTGPATSYWKTDAMASGDFTVKATFNEPKYMNLNSHPHPYGVFIGGNDMGTPSQTELYCAASGNGKFIVRGFGPEPFRVNGLLGESNAAIHKAAGCIHSSGFLRRYDRVHPPPSALISTTVASIRCPAIWVEVRSLKSTACCAVITSR